MGICHLSERNFVIPCGYKLLNITNEKVCMMYLWSNRPLSSSRSLCPYITLVSEQKKNLELFPFIEDHFEGILLQVFQTIYSENIMAYFKGIWRTATFKLWNSIYELTGLAQPASSMRSDSTENKKAHCLTITVSTISPSYNCCIVLHFSCLELH